MKQSISRYFNVLAIFKWSIIIHALCIIIKLLTYPYVAHDSLLMIFLEKVSLLSSLAVCAIIAIQAMQMFKHHHAYFMQRYKFAGLIITSFITSVIFGIIFLNKTLLSSFVSFIIHLSQQTHKNSLILLIILFILFYTTEAYHALQLRKQSLNDTSINEIVHKNIKTLAIKFCIIIGALLGFLHPIVHILQDRQIQEFDQIIIHYTTQEFLFYIYSTISILLGLWLIIGIYYVYTFYKKRK